MNKISHPPLGIIEGFFGRAWRMEDRIDYAKFLAQHQLNFYMYAPKSDVYLRKQWQQDWPALEKKALQELREIYAASRVQFGIGLSPHEIYLNDSRDKREQLKKRVQQINDLSPDILCILFDDMRGDIPALAQIQTDIIHSVATVSTAKQIIFCPTYYSFDSALEKFFGQKPQGYWEYFRNHLDPSIDIFWTGEKVISTDYTREHLQTINDCLGRKVFLWDNYPVNDSAVKSNYLHLKPVTKSRAQISDLVSGHALNPMNQAHLSKFALASLPLAYSLAKDYEPQELTEKLFHQLSSTKFARQLLQDIPLLNDQGLKQLSDKEKNKLILDYQQFDKNPFCDELIDWLKGGYTFDPTCLT